MLPETHMGVMATGLPQGPAASLPIQPDLMCPNYRGK